MFLARSVDDSCKAPRIETRAADERAVDVWL
jgi:hypothetical protein